MPTVSPPDRRWELRVEVILPALGLSAGLCVIAVIWLPGLPDRFGRVRGDYSFFLPNLLAGDFWRAANPWFALPWFTPAQCGGFVLHADPQGLYVSLTQALTAFVDPLEAVRLSFLVFAGAGYLGAYWLARLGFRLGIAASMLAGLLFMLNGFYAVRLMVGHLGFAPFMVLPGMLACLVAGNQRPGWPEPVLRCCGFGLGLAIMVQGGMAALLAPAFLSMAMVLVMAWRCSGGLRPAWLWVGGTAVGLAICAGKLAGMAALLAHVPRDAYPLPGYANMAATAWVALRAVFFAPWPDMQAMRNTTLPIMLHEFDYGVGPMPVLLMLAAVIQSALRPAWPSRRAGIFAALLAGLLLVPLALNTYGAGWAAFLKTLPILRNSSLLLRWFAAYILPATLGGAIAMHRLARRQGNEGWVLAAASAAATVAALVLTVGVGMDADVMGGYDPRPVQAAWGRLQAGAAGPAVTRIDSGNTLSAGRQNALVAGGSTLDCYQPLFGYALESFPRGSLHEGGILERAGNQLNIKNPACYLYPEANTCRPGDPFTVAQTTEALSFADYRPFAWREPVLARVADWVGVFSFAATVAVCMLAGFRLWSPRTRLERP